MAYAPLQWPSPPVIILCVLNGINIIGTVIVFSFKQITFLHESHAVVCVCVLGSDVSDGKVNLIYDKYGYKMIHNDGIAMMSHARTHTHCNSK